MDSELPTTAGYGGAAPRRRSRTAGSISRRRRPRRRAHPAAQVPARACSSGRTSTRRSVAALDQLEAEERALAPRARPAVDRAARERRRRCRWRRRRRADRRHRADRRQRPRPHGRLRPPAPHRDAAPSCATAANPFGFPSSDVIQPDRRAGRLADDPGRAPRRGSAPSGSRTRGARACATATDEEIAEAVAAARDAEVAIVVRRRALGADRTTRPTGESRDRRDLGLLGRQQELLEAVVATGTPTVLLVVSGRPLALEWAAEHCAAVVLAWVPGEAGPAAIAEVLAGDVDPGGRLPITMPRHVGQVPLTYRHHPTGGRSNWKVDYVDGPVAPLWPFGHGRSYTTFAIDQLRVDRAHPRHGRRRGRRSGSTSRTPAPRAGDEVVQLYVRDEEAIGRAPGHRAARVPAGPPRARRVPDGHLPAVDRAARLRRRRLPARRRARPGPGPRRPVLGRPAPVRGPRARRPDGRARRSPRLPDGDERRIGRARAPPSSGTMTRR